MTETYNNQYNTYIGVDETGVGDYFTPVISVACLIKDEASAQKLIELGVKDSKKLSDSKIKELAPKVMDLVHWKKTALSQKGYNNLSKNGINNNEVKTMIHTNSIKQLNFLLKNNKTPVVIDQYTNNEERLDIHYEKLQAISWMKIEKPKNEIILETHGESKSLAVACASIIARKILLDKMQEQNAEYEFEFPLGASTEVEQKAADFIKKYDEKKLYLVAKVKFATTEKAKAKSKE